MNIKSGQRETRSQNRVSPLPCKQKRLLAQCIQQRGRFHIDAHKLTLRLPICFAHGHQNIYSFTDLLKIIVSGYPQNSEMQEVAFSGIYMLFC